MIDLEDRAKKLFTVLGNSPLYQWTQIIQQYIGDAYSLGRQSMIPSPVASIDDNQEDRALADQNTRDQSDADRYYEFAIAIGRALAKIQGLEPKDIDAVLFVGPHPTEICFTAKEKK